ncbi:transport and Golgi organization protein 2 homolog isoform X3 [Adelges cooleyi]|uniref:transport and Golgi organization protein 2 homolog isoform X3 n=1 Tax=Adelges cooleyi TaxID=133065 RepID=UPI00217FF838|nr:transport and Golgi organization protein 2 homolog isoform X3 [Adelges cooleyi]
MSINQKHNIQHKDGGYRLIIASNRDEFYDRPTLSANYWEEACDIIGGRDLNSSSKGGTWLALDVKGKFSTLLNIFQLSNQPNVQSRGQLVENFLKCSSDASEYSQLLQGVYNGFKLIMMRISHSLIETSLLTNISFPNNPEIEHIPNGVKGFGNGNYQKVAQGEKRFNDIVRKYGHNSCKDKLIQELLGLLKWDKHHLPDEELAKTAPRHLDTDVHKQYSSIFVEIPFLKYGTRTHTIILLDHDGQIEYNEWTKVKEEWQHQCFMTKLKCET